MRSAFLALAACALWASCGLSGRGVDITLVFDSSVSDEALATVHSFSFVATGSETGTYVSTLTRPANRTERIEYIPATQTTMLTIAVDAKDQTGIVVAHGQSTSITVPAHGRVAVTVPLYSLMTSMLDGGAPDGDSGANVFDFTTIDNGPPPNPCADGLKDNDETGIDCGGSCPLACIGTACSSASDCSTSVCDTVCIPASGPPFWTSPYTLKTARTYACGVQRSSDGALVVAGGTTNKTSTGALDTTEILTPTGFVAGPSLNMALFGLGCAGDAVGNVYAVGGITSANTSTTYFESFNGSSAWVMLAGSTGTHSGFGFSRLDSSRLILTDSGNGEIYNITTGKWGTSANATQTRENSADVLGSDGNVYALGGDNDNTYYALVDSYNPTTNAWTSRAAMPTARTTLGGAAAGDGRIYAIGGWTGTIVVATVEAYIPSANRWTTAVAPLPAARQQTATALGPDGRIYVVGGLDSNGNVQGGAYAYGPAVTISPSSGNPGSTVTVSVTNLAGSASTNISFDSVRVAQGTSDPAGTLSVVFPVPENATPAAHTITVMDLRSLFPVTATFTVN